MVKYKVISRYVDENGKTVIDRYYKGGRGFTYEEAARLTDKLKECGCRARFFIAYIDDDE